MLKTSIQTNEPQKVKERYMIPGELYQFNYNSLGVGTKVIAMCMREQKLTVLHVEGDSCGDKVGDIWPRDGQGDGCWTKFNGTLTLDSQH